MTAFCKAAIWYAKHSLPVFPLIPRKKKPITEHGFKDATKDLSLIETWWTTNPDANIGIPMGAASGLMLLDADFRATGGRITSRDDLIELYGEIPDTAEVITPNDGRHFYFGDPGCKLPSQIAEGIELKGNGGYAVMPPSIHPNGGTYTFDGLDSKAILHPAAPPSWLIALIADANGQRANAKAASAEEKWPQGERNNKLASLAGKLRYAGLSEKAIVEALLAANRFHCDPPLRDAEVKAIAKSYGKYPPGNNPRYAEVNIDASAPSIELLNNLAVFEGRLRFVSLHRRGQMIVAKFANGSEAIWQSMTDLTCFSRAQAIIADATDILIPTPSRQRVKRMWEPAVQLILQLAVGDRIATDAAQREEFREILRSVWERAGSPAVTEPEQFVELLRECNSHQRDPQNGPPACCVWLAEDASWVHQPQLMDFLSTPLGKNKHYPWDIVRSALLLLDFQPVKSLTRSAGGNVAKANVWKGPAPLLKD